MISLIELPGEKFGLYGNETFKLKDRFKGNPFHGRFAKADEVFNTPRWEFKNEVREKLLDMIEQEDIEVASLKRKMEGYEGDDSDIKKIKIKEKPVVNITGSKEFNDVITVQRGKFYMKIKPYILSLWENMTKNIPLEGEDSIKNVIRIRIKLPDELDACAHNVVQVSNSSLDDSAESLVKILKAEGFEAWFHKP